MQGHGQEALGVEAGQHDGPPAQPVGQVAGEEAAKEEAEQVAGGEEGGKVLSLADEGPLLPDPPGSSPQEGVAPGAGPGAQAVVGGVPPHQARHLGNKGICKRTSPPGGGVPSVLQAGDKPGPSRASRESRLLVREAGEASREAEKPSMELSSLPIVCCFEGDCSEAACAWPLQASGSW